MFIQNFKTDFNTISREVKKITDTSSTTLIASENQNEVYTMDNFSDYGLSTFGSTVGFPSQFLKKVYETNKELANTIVKDRVKTYFENDKPSFYIREFNDKICGVVSTRYACFDDNQVIDILADSEIAKKQFKNTMITPERLHLRAIDDDYFKIKGDDSELYFCYFIDNSMVGQSSFKVQLGIYRRVCTNGLIIPQKQFVVYRQVHKGTKDIATEFNASLAFLSERKEEIKNLIQSLTDEDAKIEAMKEEFRKDYIAKKLNLNKKETDKVFTLYYNTYDGHSKWGMVNAITEFARDLKDINRREYIEKSALKVA